MNHGRRGFLSAAVSLLAGAGVASRLAAQQGLPAQGETGTLRDPESAGRSAERATHRDNDPVVTALEKRIQCTCGCTLDVYTCRTTDFTCTYSPGMHKEVLALQDEGKNPEEIVAAFVAKYGEKVLMAPKPEGFNVAGYVVPGLAILLVGGIMLVLLQRRARVSGALAAAMPPAPQGNSGPLAGGTDSATQEELDRLQRELRQLDD